MFPRIKKSENGRTKLRLKEINRTRISRINTKVKDKRKEGRKGKKEDKFGHRFSRIY